MSSVANRIPSALYCDLFYSNPGAGEFRRDQLAVWIRIALADGMARTADELALGFMDQFPGCTLDGDVISSVTERLLAAGHIVKHDGGFAATAAARNDVQDARQRHDRSKQAFYNEIVQYVENTSTEPLIAEERTAIASCAEELVIKCMLDERQSLEVLYEHRRSFEFIAGTARKRQSELQSCLSSKVPGSLETRLIELTSDALRAIARQGEIGKPYLHTLNRTVIGSFFLIQDPFHIQNLRDQIVGRTYYLDTNVYLAWFYESQFAHDVVKPLLEILRRYGVRLFVLPETVSEVHRVEAAARHAVPRALGDREFRKYLVRERKAIFADYWELKERDPNLTFGSYERLFMGPERLLASKGVDIVGVDFQAGEDFAAMIPTFRNAIKGAREERGRLISPEGLDHDAFAVAAMAKLQLRGERDEWGSKVSFLSLDGNLNPAIDEARNVVQKRLQPVDDPRALARMVIPLSTDAISRNDYEDYVVAAVRTQLGVAQEITGYGALQLVDQLERAGFPTRSLLLLPEAELERGLAELQGRKDLGRRIELAVAAGDPAEKEAILDSISRDLAEAVALRSELVGEMEVTLERERGERYEIELQLSSLQQQLEDVRTSLEIERGRRSDTETQLSTLSARNTRMGRVMWLIVALALAVLSAVLLTSWA